jgi:hypothetical protein
LSAPGNIPKMFEHINARIIDREAKSWSQRRVGAATAVAVAVEGSVWLAPILMAVHAHAGDSDRLCMLPYFCNCFPRQLRLTAFSTA